MHHGYNIAVQLRKRPFIETVNYITYEGEKMKKFEVGKVYRINNGDMIRIIKRTACFISYTGDRTGRSKVYSCGDSGLFGMGENVWIPVAKNLAVICMAANEM